YDWQDVQQVLNVPFQFTLTPVPVNGPSASGPGFEFAIGARPLAGLEAGATFSWNDLSFDEDQFSGGGLPFGKGERLNYSAEYTASPWFDYRWNLNAGLLAQISASATYTSRQIARISFGGATPPIVLTGDNQIFVRFSAALSDAEERWRGML